MTPQAKEIANGDKTEERVIAASSSPDFFFLSDKAADNLLKFHYAGEDRSLLYYYILSPLAAWLVNHVTPRSVAPNTITLAGLLLMTTSYCIFWYYSPNLEPNYENNDENDDPVVVVVPRWIYLFHCCSMLIYQTLDNMDGKQARRTKSSSPLGLLFDHGCDAANSIFGSANWILSIGLSARLDAGMCWALILGPMALFYVATWEEYYTGKLILPIMNGPNEGLLLGALTSLTTGLYGISYWQSTTWYDTFLRPYLPSFILTFIPSKGLRNCDIQVLMACMGFVQETSLKTLEVVQRYGIQTCWNLLPFWTLCICSWLIGMLVPEIFIQAPRTFLLLCSGLFVEQCAQLMLDHITNDQYQPMRWALLPLVALCGMVLTATVNEASEWTNDYLLIYSSCLWAFLLLKMTIVIHEICSVLGIYCFDITTQRPISTRRACLLAAKKNTMIQSKCN